jgi:hypothetical protein
MSWHYSQALEAAYSAGNSSGARATGRGNAMTPDELERMAARGEEDGYDRAWMPIVAKSHRNLALMVKAADAAKERAKRDEAEFVPRIRFSDKRA